jgi:DNA polymerase III alpha subunit
MCVVGGELVNIKVIRTKAKQQLMAFADFAFGTNSYSVTLFPWVYERHAELLKQPTAFLVAGHKDDRGQIAAYLVSDVIDVAKELEEANAA